MERMKGIRFTVYVESDVRFKTNKKFKRANHILAFRISHEIQKHLKIKAGDRIAITHDFNNEFILYLQNMKYITHHTGYATKANFGDLTNKEHRKRQIKPLLAFRKHWANPRSIPKWARTSSIAKYVLLDNAMVLVDLQIK